MKITAPTTPSSLLRSLVPALFAGALSVGGLAGCSSSVHGPVAPSTAEQRGVADENTWMTLASHGARLRVPAGWAFSAAPSRTSADAELRAESKDGKAVMILQGATNRAEFETKVRALGARYGLDQVDFQKAKPGKINGIDIVMFEDMGAESKGRPGDVFVLLGEAPNGQGIVVLFLYAADETQKYDLELINAANTLRPI